VGERTPERDVPLAPLTTLGVGGTARWFTRADDAAALEAAHRWSASHGVPVFAIGGGSNVEVADGVVDAHVVHVAGFGIAVQADGGTSRLRVAAGTPWTEVVQAAVGLDLAGVECLAGIPGSAGGTPIQNVGAYGQDVAAAIEAVVAFDRREGRTVALPASECGFGYRTSRVRGADQGRFLISEVSYRLRPGPATITYPDLVRYLADIGSAAPDLRAVRDAVLAVRRRKGMVLDGADPDTRSVGSFFVNPIVSEREYARLRAAHGEVPGHRQDGGIKVPAAWLVERSGFARGHRDGDVGLSAKHPLAVVARPGARAGEVVALAAAIKRGVAARCGVMLRAEPVFLGFGDDAEVAYLRAPGA
jgi:UDP-N-acetylmuramate dehydrogenase